MQDQSDCLPIMQAQSLLKLYSSVAILEGLKSTTTCYPEVIQVVCRCHLPPVPCSERRHTEPGFNSSCQQCLAERAEARVAGFSQCQGEPGFCQELEGGDYREEGQLSLAASMLSTKVNCLNSICFDNFKWIWNSCMQMPFGVFNMGMWEYICDLSGWAAQLL